MRVLGNILWHVPFLGFLFGIGYLMLGAILCLTIIGIPIGLGLFQLGKFMFMPFTSSLVSKSDLALLTNQTQSTAAKGFSIIARILYFPIGLLAAIGAIGVIVVEFISLIGIPCALVYAKALGTIFNPVDKVCVPRSVGEEIKRLKASGQLAKYTQASAGSGSITTNDGDYARGGVTPSLNPTR